RLEGAIEDLEMLVLQVRRALDGVALVDVLDDVPGLALGIAELAERMRNRVVDDLEEATADQLLVLDQRQVRLDTGGVAVENQPRCAGRRDDSGLRIPVAELLAQAHSLVPASTSSPYDFVRLAVEGQAIGGIPVLFHHAEHRPPVLLELGKGALDL